MIVPAETVKVKAWKAYLYEDSQLSDETLINENSEELAWDIFNENHDHYSKDAHVKLEETIEDVNKRDLTESDEIIK